MLKYKHPKLGECQKAKMFRNFLKLFKIYLDTNGEILKKNFSTFRMNHKWNWQISIRAFLKKKQQKKKKKNTHTHFVLTLVGLTYY